MDRSCHLGLRVGRMRFATRQAAIGSGANRTHRRYLPRESQLRSFVRPVSRGRRARERDASAIHAGRPRREAAATPPAGLEGQGRRSCFSSRSAEQAVPDRYAADQPAAHRADTRPDPQVLSAAGADQWRPQRPLRRRLRRGRAHDGLLRRLEAADVEMGAGIYAGRPVLHGGVRRLVPQSPVADLRVHAGRSQRAAGDARAARRTRLAQDQTGIGRLRSDCST